MFGNSRQTVGMHLKLKKSLKNRTNNETTGTAQVDTQSIKNDTIFIRFHLNDSEQCIVYTHLSLDYVLSKKHENPTTTHHH